MFTGLVETVGRVSHVVQNTGSLALTIEAPSILNDVSLGDSIAVNGVCLTVVAYTKITFTIEAVEETLRRSNLGELTLNSLVNCERAMAANSRFGGHVVQGHVDSTIEVLSIIPEGDAQNITFSLPKSMRPYVIEKGFVTIDGASLTVMALDATSFTVTIIPHTWENTIISSYQPDARINFEADMMAKYIANMINLSKEASHA